MSAFSLCLTTIFVLFKMNNCITIMETVTLHANNLIANGAKITELDVDINNNALEWKLKADTTYGFHLQLTLNHSIWAFHPTATTTLRIEVNADGNTGISDRHNLLVAFQQSGSNQYFATLISIDRVYDHEMIPYFTTSTPYSSYLSGDVKQRIDSNTYNFRSYYANYGSWGEQYKPPTNTEDRYIEAPLVFILKNYPEAQGNYLWYTYENINVSPRSCGFNTALNADTAMNIYFAADSYSLGDTVDIASITVILTYEIDTETPTNNPTNDPTNNPTIYPSKYPSISPTYNPTKIPSITPSYQPSISPTNLPSISPTTNIPSNSPTYTPSYKPTMSPTYNPSISPTNNPSENPSKRPTIPPTEQGLYIDDKATMTTTDNHTSNRSTSSVIDSTDREDIEGNNHPIFNGFKLDVFKILMVIAIFLCFCCVCCFVAFRVCSNNKHESKIVITNQHLNKISIASQSPSIGMSNLSTNTDLAFSVKPRTTSTMINDYLRSQQETNDIVRIESISRDLHGITDGNINEDTGPDTGGDTGDTGTGTGTDEDVTPTQSTMVDDNTVVLNATVTPYADDDEKYGYIADDKICINNNQKKTVHIQQNSTFSDKVNALNFMPIMVHQNEIAHHRRIFSEGPKKKDMQKQEKNVKIKQMKMMDDDYNEDEKEIYKEKKKSMTLRGDIDLNEIQEYKNDNIQNDEFIIKGDDEINDDNDNNKGTVTPFGSIGNERDLNVQKIGRGKRRGKRKGNNNNNGNYGNDTDLIIDANYSNHIFATSGH